VAWPRKPLIWLAGAALFALSVVATQAETVQVNSIYDVIARLRTCWKPPPASRAHPGIDITVIVSFNPQWRHPRAPEDHL